MRKPWILWLLLLWIFSCGDDVRRDLEYRQQVDCRGGVNLEPENAQPNQVLDARNVWCPNGRLEQRPGYVGIYAPSLVESFVAIDDTAVDLINYVIFTESPIGTFNDTADPLSIAGLAEGERYYIGFNIENESSYTAAQIKELFSTLRYLRFLRDTGTGAEHN